MENSHNPAKKLPLKSSINKNYIDGVSRAKIVQGVVVLPNPKKQDSPKSDLNQRRTSSEGQKERVKKRMIESGSLTPITNFFKKEDNQIEHKKLNGKSSTKLMGKETFEVGSSDYSN